MTGMTEGYNGRQDSPFLVRYILQTNLGPLQLSNLYEKTPIRQLRKTKGLNNTNTETEAELRLRSEAESEPRLRPGLRPVQGPSLASGHDRWESGLRINIKILRVKP